MTAPDDHLESAYEELYEEPDHDEMEPIDFPEFDPGPEVDDEGGMSEFRNQIDEMAAYPERYDLHERGD